MHQQSDTTESAASTAGARSWASRRRVWAGAGLGLALALAGGLVAGAPASALTSPHVSVHTFQAYHYADSYGRVQHYDKIGNTFKYGNWATPGHWSNQTACWANVSAYSYNFHS